MSITINQFSAHRKTHVEVGEKHKVYCHMGRTNDFFFIGGSGLTIMLKMLRVRLKS